MSHCLLNSSRYDTIVHMIMLVGKDGQIIELDGVNAMPERPTGPIIIESTTHADLRRLAEKFSLDYGNLSDALDINEAPRLEHRNNYDYLYLRLPSAKGNRNVAVATRPLLLVYNSHTLMLISGYKLQPVLDASLIHDLSRIPSSTEELVYVLARIINAFEYHIKIQTDAIHNVVVKMQKHRLQNEDFANFVMIEEQINNFISALTPLIPLFNRLQTDRSLHLSVAANDMLTDVILAAQQSISICDANTKRITNIRDAYTTLSNDSLNRVMKTLTIATLLIAAPNLVFSMYGMNIRLPMQHDDIGFLMVMLLAILLVIIFIIWGKKHRLF